MKVGKFLLSETVPLCVIAIDCTVWAIVAAYTGVGPVFIGVTVGAVAALTVLWLVTKYITVSKRLKRVERIAEQTDKCVLGEMLPKPVNAVEEEYYYVMKTVSRASLDRSEAALREQNEYRDYVERWIHEIKTPLTACRLILANGGDEAKLKTELKRAENLTECVLYYARMRTAENDTRIDEISVRQAVDEAVQSEMEILRAAHGSVRVTGDFTARTDGKALVFIIKQLLVNSAKYCPDCKIDITIENGTVTVEDNGPGIPPHELPRIFSRGFVGEIGRKNGGGTGMGLYIVSEICKNLGMEITAESETGKYARFIIKI